MFRELGDLFAPHVIDNPDEESELELLKRYAPSVPVSTLKKLTSSFKELRKFVLDGKLQYPYSTRELVNSVKHLEKFPQDGLASTLQNVFDFDKYSNEEKKLISDLFERHGIATSLTTNFRVEKGKLVPLPSSVLTQVWKKPLKSEKKPLPMHKENLDYKRFNKDTIFFPLNPAVLRKKPLGRNEGK